MAGSRGKKDQVYAALIALMAEPGNPLSISSELIRADNDILSDELAKLIEPYPKLDDRELAIVFSSQIEIGLEKAVASHFSIPATETTPLFSYPNGPLREFSAKIDPLSLSSETRTGMMDLIGSIGGQFSGPWGFSPETTCQSEQPHRPQSIDCLPFGPRPRRDYVEPRNLRHGRMVSHTPMSSLPDSVSIS